MIKGVGSVIQHVAVELAHGDDGLERVAEGAVGRDEGSDEEGQGAPCYLRESKGGVRLAGSGDRAGKAYGGDGLHAKNKGILRQVARVRMRVLLP